MQDGDFHRSWEGQRGKERRKEERPPLLHAPTNPPASHSPGPSSSPLPPSRPGPQVPPTKQRQRQRHRPPRPPRENGLWPPPTQVSRELTLAAATHKGLARANSSCFPSQALLHLLPKLNPLGDAAGRGIERDPSLEETGRGGGGRKFYQTQAIGLAPESPRTTPLDLPI